MSEVVVTRGSQITLTKDIREELNIKEGDTVTINLSGDQAILTRKDPEAFEIEGFLPDKFDEIMEKSRNDSRERLEEMIG